jgi:uncharacterized protein YegP (UPF0339 family)
LGAFDMLGFSMHFLVTRDPAGLWRWKLRMPDQRTIANSGEDYSTRVACEDGIDLVRITNTGTPIRYTP